MNLEFPWIWVREITSGFVVCSGIKEETKEAVAKTVLGFCKKDNLSVLSISCPLLYIYKGCNNKVSSNASKMH